MMSRLRAAGISLVTVLAVGIGVLVSAPPAVGAESKSVQVVSQEGRTVEFLVYLDPTVSANADSAVSSKVVVSGTEVPSEATPVIEDNTPQEAILVLDVSGSMRGPRLAAAKEAAVNYVRGLPNDVRIGLVSFNDTVAVDVAPTTDKAAVIEAIGDLQAGRKTALYDGIIAGIDLSDRDVGARLLVLSDGGDTVSAATVDDVNAAAELKGNAIDIVALTPTTEHAELLRGISAPTAGQFLLATDVTGLNQAFDEATGSFGGKVAVTADFPESVDASGKFAIVTVGVDGTDYTGTTQLPKTADLVGTGTTTTTTPTGSVDFQNQQAAAAERASDPVAPWIYALLVALIFITGGLAWASYRRQTASRQRVAQVLWYSEVISTGEYARRPDLDEGGLLGAVDKWLSTMSWYPKVDTRLDNAGVRMNVATWLLIRIVAVLVVTLLVSLLFGNALVGLVLGIAVGWLVTGLWLSSREGAKRKEFDEDLPDFLMLMASSLRSGLSFQQAIDSAANEGQGEVGRQMRRALSEVQMGSTLEAALLRVADRMQNEDLQWTVAAIAIQREVGGNLSNVLDSVARTIKARFELRREVKTLSAEGRLSGWVLAALPLGLFLYMLVANRDYVSFFWTTTIGWAMLVLIGILFVLGFVWMRRLARIEV